jgi:hypothetical protein
MGENSDNPIGTPWWINNQPADYTRRRSGLQYDSPQDLIGRKDSYKYKLSTNDPTTVSGQDGKILF